MDGLRPQPPSHAPTCADGRLGLLLLGEPHVGWAQAPAVPSWPIRGGGRMQSGGGGVMCPGPHPEKLSAINNRYL